jgi:hypothetical protein
MPFGKSPLEALEIMKMPGMILAYKYSQFRQRRREAESRRVTERELNALHHKIVSYLTFLLIAVKKILREIFITFSNQLTF